VAPRVGFAPLSHPLDMVGAFEVTGILTGPLALTRGFAGFAAIRIAAIGLFLGVAVIRGEELFATQAQPLSDALHDPVTSGPSIWH